MFQIKILILLLIIIWQIFSHPIQIVEADKINDHITTRRIYLIIRQFLDYIKFYSSTQNGNIAFTNASSGYNFARPLPKPQNDISLCQSVVSSYESNVNTFFGYRINSYCDNNTLTNIQFTFSVQINSSFIMIGFDVIVISRSFDNVFQRVYCNFTYSTDTFLYECQNIVTPNNYDLYRYVIDFSSQSMNSQYHQLNIWYHNISSVSLCYELYKSSSTKVYFANVLVILINKDNIQLNHIFHGLFYQYQQIYYDILTSSNINFKINKTRFGNDFPTKCILGIPAIDYMNINTPTLLFDIDYISGQIVNGSQNSIGNWGEYQSLCFILQCNPDFKYNPNINKCVFSGCSIFTFYQINYICLQCQFSRGLISSNGICICKQSKFIYNYQQGICQDYCGNGITVSAQCDDGNQNNEDGCTNQCKIMTGFQCKVTYSKTTCKYHILLKLQIIKIQRLSDVQAKLYIYATNNFFPFDFTLQNFQSDDTSKSMINITVVINQNPKQTIQLGSEIVSASGRQLQIIFNYNQDIEGFSASLTLDTSKTNYICLNNQSINFFTMKGQNGALRISTFQEAYQSLQTGMSVNIIITNIILFIGLLSRKFIGLECILVLQLIYYSQILVSPWSNFPVELESIKSLKYSNGYNQIFNKSQNLQSTQIQRKLNYLQINKLIIQNYNVNFILLLFTFIVFLIVLYLNNLKIQKELKKKRKENQTRLKNQSKNVHYQKKKIQRNKFVSSPEQLDLLQKIISFLYRFISQVSLWIILQITSSFHAFILISNKNISIETIKKNPFNQFGPIILMVSFIIVISIGLNNFNNLYLNQKIFNLQTKRPEELKYKKILFIYLFTIGLMLFIFSQISNYMSLIVLAFHVFYLILINFKVRPYKNALKIHSFSLFLHHFNYLIFLVFINLINFVDNLHPLIKLSISFLVTFICLISIVISLIRLYYQYRYGQQLQIKLKKQEQERKKQELKRKKQIQLKKNKMLQKIAQQKIIQTQLQQNIYTIQNQILQANKQAYLNFLQSKKILTKQQQQINYYEKFNKKPMNWLQKNDKKKYQQIIQNRQEKLIKSNKKTNEDPDFIQLKKKMMKQTEDKKKKKIGKQSSAKRQRL